jgi:hypothetical protein
LTATAPAVPPEKPLHVRVAEAIGWTETHETGAGIVLPGAVSVWRGRPPGDVLVYVERDRMPGVSRFDTDWSVTGPLLERLDIGLRYFDSREFKELPLPGSWGAEWPFDFVKAYTYAAIPLVAACEAIVAMSAEDPEGWSALLAGRRRT